MISEPRTKESLIQSVERKHPVKHVSSMAWLGQFLEITPECFQAVEYALGKYSRINGMNILEAKCSDSEPLQFFCYRAVRHLYRRLLIDPDFLKEHRILPGERVA